MLAHFLGGLPCMPLSLSLYTLLKEGERASTPQKSLWLRPPGVALTQSLNGRKEKKEKSSISEAFRLNATWSRVIGSMDILI